MAVEVTQPTKWTGWVYFAGILMIIRAFFQGFSGVVALTKPTTYILTEERLAILNFTAWGWIHIVIGILLLSAGFSVIAGGMWGRIVGVIITVLAVFANLAFLPAYPVWSTIAIVIDVLILYALIVHAGEIRVRE